MSYTRTESTESKEARAPQPAPSPFGEISNEMFRIVTVGGSVAAGLLPLEFALHSIRSGQSFSMPKFGPTGVASFAMASGRAYKAAFKGACTKNAVVGQRENVSRAMEEGRSVEESTAHSHEEGEVGKKTLSGVNAIGTAVALGTIDAAICNYTGVKSVWAREALAQQMRGDCYAQPKPESMYQHWKTATTGFSLRATRCSANVAGLVFSPMVASQCSSIFPQIGGFDSSTLAANAFNATIVGTASNVCDVLYQRKVVGVDPVTFKAPSTFRISGDMYRREGIRGFLRGTPTACLYTGFAYTIITGVENALDKHCMPQVERATARFFQPAPVEVSKKPAKTDEQRERSEHESRIRRFG